MYKTINFFFNHNLLSNLKKSNKGTNSLCLLSSRSRYRRRMILAAPVPIFFWSGSGPESQCYKFALFVKLFVKFLYFFSRRNNKKCTQSFWPFPSFSCFYLPSFFLLLVFIRMSFESCSLLLYDP